MTPAERARQIDQEEFAAECAAIRQRALVYAHQHRQAEAAKLDAWINEGKKRKAPRQRGLLLGYNENAVNAATRANLARAKRYEAFGQSRSLREWAEETGITHHTLRSRISNGWPIEEALTVPIAEVGKRLHRNRQPGVVSDFRPSSGTGAGSTAQERLENNFSKETAE